ncbi:TlpA family protein disulfide reductase [Candidatus Kaistella beijingensis]|uniref:TlpA family protein disulfide reductase n=1 Tax=Candidatus Kaistella beijingensis TaxID=2820270 RepID=UPI001CC3A694|nr:TlpA disulfide reductase family protein [Candidatus Kaistella beijingensis]UBB90381.1 TlpA family protein disulfide reductase [Candidatus Kaistella beijingensis]
MENLKIWVQKNGFTVILVGFFALMLFSPDAKAWFLRQIASTGILNSKIEAPKDNASENIENQPIANFSVTDVASGDQISTADLKGKVVFINFWASWCPPCRAEFPSIQKFYEKYKSNQQVVFLTVNLDDNPELGKKYLAKENFSIPFLIPSSEIPKEVFSGSLPTTVVLDKKGVIRLHHQGVADYSTANFYEQIDGLISEK